MYIIKRLARLDKKKPVIKRIQIQLIDWVYMGSNVKDLHVHVFMLTPKNEDIATADKCPYTYMYIYTTCMIKIDKCSEDNLYSQF